MFRSNPGPRLIVAPEVLTARGDTASDVRPQISREAERAEQMEHLFWNELQRECIEGEWLLFFPRDTAAFIDLAKSFDLTILASCHPRLGQAGFRRAKS